MKTSGNTILITGGGSGIGRALAEAFHERDNQVIIAGRRQALLDEVTQVNPGMQTAILDVTDSKDIDRFVLQAAHDYPHLNVVINNAGIMHSEDWTADVVDTRTAKAIIETNFLGPILLTAGLMPLLRMQRESTVVTVSSGLAFLPLAATPTYSATKAAIHSFSESLRHQLKGTSVNVIEIAPPYLQTELMGKRQASDPNAMPLAAFIDEVLCVLETQPEIQEVLVQRVLPQRFALEKGQTAYQEMFDKINGKR
ncbi:MULTISPECIES: SDR family oxidoreductase [Duganella]|uniref:SDR family NAD(P)-dependent oxidoreductase n=2 Tax=Duganella TaxID=75654 RepID=A0A845GSC8_9BURK|nr:MULTISPECIES: SDR family oxidoreductase [Duganella]MYM80760.1 SDR family NAD(P)-dependent oxidoreductase [Duganella lactea]MYM96136.1 SDR family NAD(P)-dependent oxidoreductase [Duganella vulcania]